MLITPSRAPPIFIHTRCTARPIVAFARQPGPKSPTPQFTERLFRIGPFTMSNSPTASVVPDTPTKPNAGSVIAWTAAMTTGMYSGRHPAITAFTAIFSTVAWPSPGAMRATTCSAGRPLASTAASTHALVGGTTGNPSVTPRA